MFFRYKCISEDGERVEGVIEASDKDSAIFELKKMFNLILEVEEEKVLKKRRKIDRRDLIMFTNILSISVNAGVPIVKALELVYEGSGNKEFKEVLSMVISSVRGGKLFSEALSLHPDVFDIFYISVVKAGESSGKLGVALENLSRYLEKSYNIISKIRSAMVYPVIILGVAIGVVFLFLTSIVPRFSEIYSSYGTSLPYITQITIDVGNFVKDNIILIIICIFSLVFLIRFLYRKFEDFRNYLQMFIINVFPALGNFILKSDVERFSRVMSIMLGNGVMILDALDIASKTVYLVRVKRALEFCISEVERGRFLSEVLGEDSFFPSLLVQMVKVGEETGELDKTLGKLADFYSFELDKQSEILVSSISPIMIVIVGLIVGFLVLSLFMPMFSLQQVLIR